MTLSNFFARIHNSWLSSSVLRMPAYSPMDGKDRVLGDGVSALDRRKTSINRKAERWAAGDYGDEKG